jgi:hypothetical protein
MQDLRHRIEVVLPLVGRQDAVQDAFRHQYLDFHPFHRPSQSLFGPHRQIQSALFSGLDREIVADVDGDRHDALAADVVRDEAEVAVGRDEGEDSFGLPSLEADARVEADVVEEAGVHEGERQVGHAAQFYATVDLGGRKIDRWKRGRGGLT